MAFKPLSDQLPPVLLGGETPAQSCELLLGERYSDAATLARYFDEACFGAGSDGAGELYAISHGLIGSPLEGSSQRAAYSATIMIS